jgi:hypothetical protein
MITLKDMKGRVRKILEKETPMVWPTPPVEQDALPSNYVDLAVKYALHQYYEEHPMNQEELLAQRDRLRAEGRELLLEGEHNVAEARALYDEADKVDRQINKLTN